MPKKIVFFTLMFCVFLISSVLLSELILRIAGWGGYPDLRTASQEVVASIPGVFEPGQDFIKVHKPQLPHRISINSLGYRGPEVRLSNGVIRILCLGDSFTFGDYVSDDETFPYILKKVFDETSPERVEVINGGVGGTTIVDQLYFLHKSQRIHPDVVVLTFYENDIRDLGKAVPLYLQLESNRKWKSKPGVNLIYSLVRDSAVFTFGLEMRGRLSNLSMQSAQDGTQNDSTQACNLGLLNAYERHLNEMKIFSESNSIKLMLALFPSHHRWARPYDDGCGASRSQLDEVERIAVSMGIPALNLLPALKRSNVDVRQLYLLPYDGHASKHANKIVANAIYGFVQNAFPATFGRDL